jgi:hypothetical protein
MGEGAFVRSVLDTHVDACPYCSGHGLLVGYRTLDDVDAGDDLRLCLVFRAHLSLWRLDVRAAAWSGSTAETGTDELAAGERWDLSKNETTGFDGRRLFANAHGHFSGSTTAIPVEQWLALAGLLEGDADPQVHSQEQVRYRWRDHVQAESVRYPATTTQTVSRLTHGGSQAGNQTCNWASNILTISKSH